MKYYFQKSKGFSLVELLIIIGIIGIFSTIIIMNMQGSEISTKETKLKVSLANLRQALFAYKTDHGFYPCTNSDHNFNGDEETFRRQLTWYTDKDGKISPKQVDEFSFGPYLHKFPPNPFYEETDVSKSMQIEIDTKNENILEVLKDQVAKGQQNGGWYYQAKSGIILPNLGGPAFSDEYCYY